MEQKKSNIFLALLLSALAALAGGVIFGLIYLAGYYVYFLAILEIIFCCTMFFKFKEAKSWKVILPAVLWSLFWCIAFNFLAIVLCETLALANEFNLTFTESFTWLIELWKTSPEVTSYMNLRMFQIIGMIILGGIVYGGTYIFTIIKTKKSNNPSSYVENKKQTEIESKTTNIKEIYLKIFNECKISYKLYLENKDKVEFKNKLANIKQTLITNLTNEEKNTIKSAIEKKLSNTEAPTSEKNILKIIATLFN